MAQTVYLYLKLNGSDIQGESTETTLGRQDSIECINYEQGVKTAVNTRARKRSYDPVVVRKRIDKSSPLLLKALVQNQVADATFKFFREKPDQTTEHFYTVELNGRVTSVKQVSPASSTESLLEEVAFAPQSIKWTYLTGNVWCEDSVG